MRNKETKGKDMIRIELEHSDAYRCFGNVEDFTTHLVSIGCPAMVYDAKFNVFRIPAFAQNRKNYSAVKAEYCAKYGCE